MLIEVFLGSVMANGAAVALLYGIWRLDRKSDDYFAMAVVLFTLAVIGVAAWALKFPG